jgi:hypothetical protein
MILRPLTDGKVSTTGTMVLTSGLFGGALMSADGTNAAAVTVTDSSGKKILDVSTKTPMFINMGPVQAASKSLDFSVSGTGASAQFYEAVP